ncbi:hypothetical protein [Humidisolicoccus flavus]|uniref:hypothetical protein n=1 Tax=Humidisolicoccus flavus TaxID=3111414 RepID=UPI0032515E14
MKPTRRDKLKPVEYIGFAGIIGVFTGLVVAMAVRSLEYALIFGGVAFIGTIVVSATVMLAVKPRAEESEPRNPIVEDKE